MEVNNMLISIDHPEANRVVVFLNGRPLKTWLQARDGNDGWVDVPDPSAMAPLGVVNTDPWNEMEQGSNVDHYESFAVKRLYGQIEFRRANVQQLNDDE
jgi:hypothetical protein